MVKIYKKEPDKKIWENLSGGPMRLMKMDMKLYKGVKFKIVKIAPNYYTFWVHRKDFRKKGYRLW